jgi:polysaccharide pyruvyl transferase WcaK-like protein
MILAIDYGIPFVGVSYAQKTLSVLEDLEWKYSFEKNISSESLVASIIEIEKQYSLLENQLLAYQTSKKEEYKSTYKSFL